MDDNSRKIVKIIATITVVALLVMAARLYTRSQEEPMPPAGADEKVEAVDSNEGEVTEDPLADPADEADPLNPDEETIEEDAELIMGEPSINLEQGRPVDFDPVAETESTTQTDVPGE